MEQCGGVVILHSVMWACQVGKSGGQVRMENLDGDLSMGSGS